MPGFLLEDDAIAARQQEMDTWLEERKRQAEEAKRAAQAALQPVQQAVAPIQQAVQQAVQSTGDYLGTLDAEQQARQQEFDQWLQSRPRPEPVTQPTPPPTLVAGQPQAQGLASQPSLSHAEEPATSTDTLAAPDLGGRWKTQFDFGATYTGSYRTGTPHRGVDMVPTRGGVGTEVDAFAPGTVSLIQRDPGAGGLMVYVLDDQGLTHAYMHLAGTAPGLKVGDRVQRGTPIAQMGESGTEGSPHLHYEVRKNAATGDPLDQLIDPRPYVAGQRQATVGAATSAGAPASPVPTTAALSGGGELASQVGERGQQILNGAADIASWLGEQGQKAVQAVLVTEGGLAGARGDNAKSAGPLQFFGEEGGRPGQLNNFAQALGMSLEQARQYVTEHPLEAIRWAIGTAANPGYLGAAIIDGLTKNLTGASLAEHVQRIGQVSVSPERAGAVWNSLFGQGQPVQQAVGGAAPTARAGAEGALGEAVQASGRAREQATGLLDTTRQTGEVLRQEAEAAQARYDQWRADQQRRAAEFSQGTQGMLDQARAGLSQFDPNVGLRQAGQMAQDLAATPIGRAVTGVPLPMAGGQTLGQMGEALQPENLVRAGQMIGGGVTAANVEAERQMAEPIGLQAARLGAGIAGRELAPEVEQGIRTAARTVPGLNLLDPGGVVAAGLKGGGLTSTVNLPILGEVPLADVLGLAANFLVPTGGEARFGEGALRTGLTEASRLNRPLQQWGAAMAVEQGLGRAGRAAMDQATAFRMAISGAGRWARASVEDIANDLSRSPIGDFLRDEAGTLDVDALMQAARAIKAEMVRVYSGTARDFERVDLSRADPDALFGPGAYTTEDPRIAGGRVSEAQQGWAARFGRPEYGFDYGPIKPTQREAADWLRQQNADLLARYPSMTSRELPPSTIVPRALPAVVEEEGYAQAAASRAGQATQETFDSYERNIKRLQGDIQDIEARLAAGESPQAPVGPNIANPIGAWLEGRREQLARITAARDNALAQSAGGNVRAIDVPRNLKLFDMDEGMDSRTLYDLADHAAERGMPQTERALIDQALTSMRNYPPPGQTVYDALQREAGLSKTQANQFLESAGYDGITHMGGGIRPMLDEFGQRIEHRVRVLFQSGLDKSRNAYSGNLAAAVPGGAAGAASDEDLSPQERLYRGLGGAFVAGALRKQNPALAAFEAQALRKGATAREIAAAVQSARQTAGKAYKFSGPIADAVNQAFQAAPGREAVLGARQFLREFGGNLRQAAPPGAQTDSGMARLHNRLLELARQGESQRFWYTNASEAIKEAAQGDKVKAEKLAQLFAIYSPGATVSANTQMALAAWHQFLEGVPINVGKGQLDRKAQRLLYDNKPWEGRKTNNFYRNLMKRIDPEVWASWGRQDGQTGTTVDIWMMRALQYLQDAPSMGPGGQYEFSQRAIERVARELGWQPDEAQAAIWSSVKAASEGTGLVEAGYHYGTGLAERTAQVGGPRLPAIFQDEAGQDVLAKAAGVFGQEGQIPVPAEKASRTLYDAEGNPIYNPKAKTKEAISVPIPEAKGAISAAAQRTIDAYAAARAWVQKLPQISWSRVFVEPKPTQRDSNSLAVFLGRTITPEEEQQLATRIGGQVDVVPTQDGAIIVNMAGRHERTPGDPLAGQWIGESNVDFHKRANAALAQLDTVEEASTSPFRAHTNTLTNDWEANPNGESYAAVIGRSARAEALWDVARPLAARAREGITAATYEPAAAAQRAATELGTAATGAAERAAPIVSGAQDIAGELAQPRLADTGLAQGLRGALQPTDAEVLAAASPQARANAERLVSLTSDNPTEADIANALRASEIGAGAAGPQRVASSAAARIASSGMPARASAQFAANLGGAVAGVAGSEATMSEEDRANPWVRITRDLAFGGAGLAAPGVTRGVVGQAMGRTPTLRDIAQLRATVGGTQQGLSGQMLGAAQGPMTPGQLISAVGKQNLLTGFPTHLANIASQLVELGLMPARAAMGGRGDEAYIGLRAAIGSVPEALAQFRQTFSTGVSTTAQGAQQTQKWLPIFRFIGATDDFFRVMGGHMGSAMEAQRLVNEAGATTPQAIQQVLQANQGQIYRAGQKTGAASVFQAMGAQGAQDLQTPFGRWKESLLGALPSGPGAGPWLKAGAKQGFGLLVDALVPFSGMPARLFDIGIGRIPGIGETRYAIQLGRALAKGDKRAAQEALGDLGVQSIISGVIFSNTLAGNVTGPDNKEHPNSVKINGTWVDYSRWGAFQLPLAIPGATIEAWKQTGNRPDARELDYLSAVGNAWFKTARNAFFLDSAFDLVERLGSGAGVGALAQTATSYTDRISPAFINQVEQAMDANIRQVSREFPRSVVERAASRIPYLAQMLPAQVEMTTGGARIRERQGPLGVLVGAETGVQPKVERELYRLRDQAGFRDLSVPREAPTTVSVGGTTIRLTEAEQHKLAAERGKLIDQMAGEFVRGAGYERLTDQEKALTLKRLMDRAESRNAALWLAMTPSTEVEARMRNSRDVAGRRELVGAGR